MTQDKMKAYHSVWSHDDRMKAHSGIVIDDGEAWRYLYTHEDAEGPYDLWYRNTDPFANEDRTLRDWFAGQALPVFLNAVCFNGEALWYDTALAAKNAYEAAGAMLEARKE